jgi:pimeloyl-ACP methyl ester carboxylesterase
VRVEQRIAGELSAALAVDPAAPALVLLHGLGATWRVWQPALDGLARRYRVIAFDLPGFGRSPAYPGRVFPLDGVAGRIAGALDALGVGEHALGGHSMGGGVAIAYAAARPDRVRRLVLVAPAGLIATGAVRRSWRSPVRHRLGREATRLAEPLLLVSGRARRLGFARLVHDPGALSRRAALSLTRGSRSGRGTGPAGIAIVNAGLRDRVDRLTMPTLVVWGLDDRVVDAGYAEVLAAALPDGRALTLPETGHLPMLERPATFVDAVDAFLRGAAA